MAEGSKIDVALTFQGDKSVVLTTKDPDFKTLLEVMFKNTAAWGATWTDSEVLLKPMRPNSDSQ